MVAARPIIQWKQASESPSLCLSQRTTSGVYVMNRKVLRASIPIRNGTKEVYVISRRDLRIPTKLRAERFSDRVYIDHGKDS